MDKDLKGLMEFIELLNKFQRIERKLHAVGEERNENDAEHSYELAMAAWYIIETKKLNLDKNRAVLYALIHDFVEVHAGDTPAFHTDLRQTKVEREMQALKKLENEFPEVDKIWKEIREYEKLENEEAKFVYALDKIIPMINGYHDGGRSWKRDKITYEMDMDYKKDKVRLSPVVEKYFNNLLELLKKEKHLFLQE